MSNMVVRTNVLALNSHRNLGNVSNQQARSSARLSSGFRINSAADDAAGLGISENMRSQIRGLDQASRNAQDAISLVQTAEGGMSTINEMVIRIRELTVQAANDINTAEGATGVGANESNRARIQGEINHLIDEIERTATTLEFNGMALLDGTFETNGLHFQVGANSGQAITVNIPNIAADVADTLRTDFGSPAFGAVTNNSATGTVATGDGATISALLDGVDAVLAAATASRGALGAIQNRLEFTIQNLDVSSENLSAANSRIRDTDMAAEMMSLTQANVLQQAATAMLAQANQAPQSILQLLG